MIGTTLLNIYRPNAELPTANYRAQLDDDAFASESAAGRGECAENG